jgi:ABC-type multidrug transport system ATPase subunit
LHGNAELNGYIVLLHCHAAVLFLLAWYLNTVAPDKHGPRRPWNFCCKKSKVEPDGENDEEQPSERATDYDNSREDADAKAERNMVNSLDVTEYERHPLIVKDFRMVVNGLSVLTSGHQEIVAVKNLSFRLKQGEKLAIVGPHGSGKTTLMKGLTGLVQARDKIYGSILISGHDVVKNDPTDALLPLGYCPQKVRGKELLRPELTVVQTLQLFARVKGVPPFYEQEYIDKMLHSFRLKEIADQYFHALEVFEKKKVALAASLVHNPSLAVLDEPFEDLDDHQIDALLGMLRKVLDGKTLLLTTRNIQAGGLLVGGSGRLAILDEGVMVAIAQKRRLLNLYGAGSHLTLRLSKKNPVGSRNVDAIKRNITELFVDNAASAPEIVEETNAQIVYKLPADTIRQEIEEFMQYKASNLGIASWDLAQLGLSDIYYNLLA